MLCKYLYELVPGKVWTRKCRKSLCYPTGPWCEGKSPCFHEKHGFDEPLPREVETPPVEAPIEIPAETTLEIPAETPIEAPVELTPAGVADLKKSIKEERRGRGRPKKAKG